MIIRSIVQKNKRKGIAKRALSLIRNHLKLNRNYRLMDNFFIVRPKP